MLRCILRAKIHIATVTESNLAYEGSITIDETILRKADILPYEQVMISNLNNGERFETYAIPGEERLRRNLSERPHRKKRYSRRQDHHLLLQLLRGRQAERIHAENRLPRRKEQDCRH